MVRQFIPNIEARESRRRPNSPLQCIDVAGPLSLNASVYRYPNPITAKDFLASYNENMRVRYIPYEGSCVREVVARIGMVYSNPAHSDDDENSSEAEAWRIKQRITDCQNNSRSPIRITTNHEDAIIQCRAGRGAVQHYQTYLSYALSYTHNHPRPRIQPSELTHYCSERTGTWAYLGLDCIGFVNRYLMASGRIPATMAGASPGIEQHRERQRPGRRMNVGQIEANDLIIQGESGHQHIAIVNRVVNRTTTTTPDVSGEAITTLEVSESSQSYGGLVTHNWYILSDRGGGNFRCRKPNQTRNIQNDWGFYAAPPIAARGRAAAG